MYVFLRFYLFMRDTQRSRDIGRERSRLPARSPMWDLIPGPEITPRANGRCLTTDPPRHPGAWSLSLFSPAPNPCPNPVLFSPWGGGYPTSKHEYLCSFLLLLQTLNTTPSQWHHLEFPDVCPTLGSYCYLPLDSLHATL